MLLHWILINFKQLKNLFCWNGKNNLERYAEYFKTLDSLKLHFIHS
jgi:hypothetical protein